MARKMTRKQAAAKAGRASARKRKSGGKRKSTRKRKSLGGSGKTIKSAIKLPGALSRRAKRAGRSTTAQARHDKKHGTTLQKQQANFYLRVLKPSSKKKP